VTIGEGRTNASIARDPFSRCVWCKNVNAMSEGIGSSPCRVSLIDVRGR
jgi:hypothetical protein